MYPDQEQPFTFLHQKPNPGLKRTVAHGLCELFADVHELPVDYVWAEFANPEVDSLETVNEALDIASLLVYN
jgi:hypothetical protein